MKTATEWKQIWLDDREPIDNKTFEQRLTDRIEAIQLDAMKEGMRKEEPTLKRYNKLVASLLTNGGKVTKEIWDEMIECQQEWGRLTACDHLTEKDL